MRAESEGHWYQGAAERDARQHSATGPVPGRAVFRMAFNAKLAAQLTKVQSGRDARAAAAAHEAARQSEAKAEVGQARNEAQAAEQALAKSEAEAEAYALKAEASALKAAAATRPPATGFLKTLEPLLPGISLLCAARTAKPTTASKREEQMRQRLPAPPKTFRTIDVHTLAALTHDELRSAMEGAGLGGLVEPVWRSLARLRDGDASPEAVSAITPEALLVCEVLERIPNTAEQQLNILERATGLDLDGDGDVGRAGAASKPAREMSFGEALLADAEALSKGGLNGREQSWNVVEKITGLDLDRDGDVGVSGAEFLTKTMPEMKARELRAKTEALKARLKTEAQVNRRIKARMNRDIRFGSTAQRWTPREIKMEDPPI